MPEEVGGARVSRDGPIDSLRRKGWPSDATELRGCAVRFVSGLASSDRTAWQSRCPRWSKVQKLCDDAARLAIDLLMKVTDEGCPPQHLVLQLRLLCAGGVNGLAAEGNEQVKTPPAQRRSYCRT